MAGVDGSGGVPRSHNDAENVAGRVVRPCLVLEVDAPRGPPSTVQAVCPRPSDLPPPPLVALSPDVRASLTHPVPHPPRTSTTPQDPTHPVPHSPRTPDPGPHPFRTPPAPDSRPTPDCTLPGLHPQPHPPRASPVPDVRPQTSPALHLTRPGRPTPPRAGRTLPRRSVPPRPHPTPDARPIPEPLFWGPHEIPPKSAPMDTALDPPATDVRAAETAERPLVVVVLPHLTLLPARRVARPSVLAPRRLVFVARARHVAQKVREVHGPGLIRPVLPPVPGPPPHRRPPQGPPGPGATGAQGGVL